MKTITRIFLNDKLLKGANFYYERNTKSEYVYAKLLDSRKEFICNFYSKERFEDFLINIQNVDHISQLAEIGVCLNVMWAESLEELYEEWVDFCEEEYSYEDFIDNIPINVVDNKEEQIYFIVDYTEV